MANSKNRGIRIDDELWMKVGVRAEAIGVTRSTLVRIAVENYLENRLNDYARGYEAGMRETMTTVLTDDLL